MVFSFFKRKQPTVNISNNNGSIVVNGNHLKKHGFANVLGSGNRIRSTLPYQEFESIDVRCHINVSIEISNDHYIEVFAEDNLIDLIEVRLDQKQLIVELKDNVSFQSHHPIELKMSTRTLKLISLNGSGLIKAIGLDQRHLNIHLNGSGNIYLQGKAHDLTATLNGSGNIDASTLKSDSVQINLNGSGMVEVNAAESAVGRLNGSGKIVVYGNPKKKTHEQSGSGKIKFN